MELSLVIPVFNEEEALPHLRERLEEVGPTFGRSYEVLLIDDGSSDGSFPFLKRWQSEDPERIRVIRFRRNFGQTAAMAAGFAYARGEVVITLDADCQNDPGDVPLLMEKVDEGYDVVSGWRRDRQDTFLTRKLPSMMANKLISRLTGVALHDYGCTLKAYRREIFSQVRLYGEMHRFIPALASWVGGSICEVPVNHHPRRYGTSKYGLGRTVRVVLDLMTVKFLLRYSTGPMQMIGKIGLSILVPGALWATWQIIERFFMGRPLGDRPAFLLALMMCFLGVHFLSLGLLAEIQTRTYHESQDKPIFTVREILERPEET